MKCEVAVQMILPTEEAGTQFSQEADEKIEAIEEAN